MSSTEFPELRQAVPVASVPAQMALQRAHRLLLHNGRIPCKI